MGPSRNSFWLNRHVLHISFSQLPIDSFSANHGEDLGPSKTCSVSEKLNQHLTSFNRGWPGFAFLTEEVTQLFSFLGHVEMTGWRLTLMFRAARLRSKVYWTSPDRPKGLRWLLGMKVLFCREAWWPPSMHRTWHWEQQVSSPSIPTKHPYGKAPACLRQAAHVEICRNEEPLCTAWQIGSRAQSITWFSDSQPSCLVITLTLINFKVQWWTKFRKSHPLLQFLPKLNFCYKFKQLCKCGKKPLE